ncbi:MAG TPA: arginyltransferase [Rhodospirillales bacterium]|nr:arginyltransferase [Rhodospirillales bacterium]
MRHSPPSSARFFFTTAPLPCPYFPDRIERRVVTELLGRDANNLHDILTHAGFRRSHGIAYAPSCPDCNACTAVRILVDDFKPSRSQRRITNRNNHLQAFVLDPCASEEQFVLFTDYQSSRHSGGDMEKMNADDYRSLVEETNVNTRIVEFRDDDDKLVACCLIDVLSDGLSALYSFFDPHLESRRSLGTYMILWLTEHARALGLDYVYLGFWIGGCAKMSYKASFKPLEGFNPSGWRLLESQ